MDQHLGHLRPGQRARVAGLDATGAVRRKLLALGVTPGCEVELVRCAPFGDPVEVALRGYRLCLRRLEAACVRVEELA